MGHGDWVVDTICSGLENPERTAILCIDVDTLNGYDSHLDNLFDLDYYSSFERDFATKFESLVYDFLLLNDARFNTSTRQICRRWFIYIDSGAPASVTEGIALDTFEQNGIPIIQAAPNVGQGYYDWGFELSRRCQCRGLECGPERESSARQRFHHRDRGYC